MSATSFQRRRRELAEAEAKAKKTPAKPKKTRAKAKKTPAKPKKTRAKAKKTPAILTGEELSDNALRDVINEQMGEMPGDDMTREELAQMFNELSS